MTKPIALLLAVLITSTTVHAETLKPDTNFHAPRFVTPYPAVRMLLLANGKILRFSSVDTLVDQPAGPLTRYLADGTLDSSFQFTRDYSNVLAVLELPSGKLIVAAQRNEYNRVVEEIIRLNNDGSVDSSFTTTLVRTDGSDDVRALLVQPDGKILASGPFTHFGGETRPGIVRLLPDG